MLHANKIPTGLCYQRLSLVGKNGPFCLHRFNSVYFKKYGWYRVDAGGNKSGINAQFCPLIEQLAFSVTGKYEMDLHKISIEPLLRVIETLTKYKDNLSVNENLPDIE